MTGQYKQSPWKYHGTIPNFEDIETNRYHCVGRVIDNIEPHIKALDWENDSYIARSILERHKDENYANYNEENSNFSSIEPTPGDYFSKMGAMTRMKNCEVFIHKMDPARFTILHQDFYKGFRERHGYGHIGDDEVHNIVRRYWVTLQDWKSGHYYETNGNPIVGWKAGDVHTGPGYHPHLAANAGLVPRYFCVITGLMTDDMFGDKGYEEIKLEV